MRRSEKESVSAWQSRKAKLLFPPLRNHLQTDICVIGAGIAGLTTAYLLQKEGKSVSVIDAWGLAAGETGRTTAHLTAVLDDRFHNLERVFGEEKTRLAKVSHEAAIDRIESIVREENIVCDFERLTGYLFASSPAQEEDLKKEAKACRKFGFKLQEIHGVPLPHVNAGPALEFPQQATFNITKYMHGLAKVFQGLGGKIYTGTRIVTVNDGTPPHCLTEDGFKIDAQSIVICTNTPVNDLVKMHTKQAAYRTYVVAFQVPKGSYKNFLLWDMHDPYHYVRIVRGENGEDLMLVGGEDHKTGQANDAEARYRRLEDWTRKHFDLLGPVAFEWSGQVMEPVDHLAFIGRNPGGRNVYIATGDSGHGMTHSTIAGMLITDLIQGRPNSWETVYDPARVTMQTVPTYLRENANFVGCMISDWAAPSEVAKIADIPTGEGAILRRGLSKVAVYRAADGSVQECSAVCTHLNCVVQWNSGEKSWDCPCHGSRFDTEGNVLNGPAIRPLEEIFTEEKTGIGEPARDLPTQPGA